MNVTRPGFLPEYAKSPIDIKCNYRRFSCTFHQPEGAVAALARSCAPPFFNVSGNAPSKAECECLVPAAGRPLGSVVPSPPLFFHGFFTQFLLI
jgi:hypothetical protein